MRDQSISDEAAQQLTYAFERDGKSPVVVSDQAVFELKRSGLVELVTIGVNEPLVVLTPAGHSVACQVRSAPLPAEAAGSGFGTAQLSAGHRRGK